ncbi:MAG: hypothetical protein IJT75_06230 [Bacteroidaceae bacterium]|nr:hypothetical protein [Bacteroidaceae bacterium]
MSDGNFNRSLLPHTPYSSGLKAGKAMARMWAVEAFEEWLQTEQPGLTADERSQKVEAFTRLLMKRER